MREFVIYAPPYNSESGGTIVLHRLCDQLNRTGYSARLHPLEWHHVHLRPLPKRVRKYIGGVLRDLQGVRFYVNPDFLTPVVSRSDDLENAIAVYPEVVSGNPLRARRVVRWLLYKSQLDEMTLRRNQGDLYYYFQEVFKIQNPLVRYGGKLQVMHWLTSIYKQLNTGERSGTCYLMRKGKATDPVHGPRSICIDNLSHGQIAKIFNETERFFSYDGYTLFSQYAALCGCLSIVVPQNGQTKEQWQADEGLRLGVAYGLDDIKWARETASRVAGYFAEQRSIQDESVVAFAEGANRYFYERDASVARQRP